ncbi:LOW QUALITY PROTEIN: U3 small nucleolar RNA-associated protein 14-A, partial [Galemys pyrenaicus]
ISAAWGAMSLLTLSQQEELEDLLKDDPWSSSEDKGDSNGERRQRLLKQSNRWKLADRSEASLKVSEFNTVLKDQAKKLVLSDLHEPFKTSPSLATVKKQLNRVKSKKIVELPVNKEEAEQIYREVGFNETSQALPSYPLNVCSVADKNSPGAGSFHLLHKNKQPVTDPLLILIKKASLKAISLVKAKTSPGELLRAHALQLYYKACTQRGKKIKGKNPERTGKLTPTIINLKHHNSGKWVESKYDLEACQAMKEQFTRNKELMQKHQSAYQIQTKGVRLNLWILRSCSRDARESEIQEYPEQHPEPVTPNVSESKVERPLAEEMFLKELKEKLSLREKAGLILDAEAEGCQKNSKSQELLLISGHLEAQKENHQSRKHKVTPAGRVPPVQKKRDPCCWRGRNEHRLWKNLKNWAKMDRNWKMKKREIKQMLKEAFARDDVIRDFLKEKREAVEASKNLPNVVIGEKQNIHAPAYEVCCHIHSPTMNNLKGPSRPLSDWHGTPRGSFRNPKLSPSQPYHQPIKAKYMGYWSFLRSEFSPTEESKMTVLASQKTAEDLCTLSYWRSDFLWGEKAMTDP